MKIFIRVITVLIIIIGLITIFYEKKEDPIFIQSNDLLEIEIHDFEPGEREEIAQMIAQKTLALDKYKDYKVYDDFTLESPDFGSVHNIWYFLNSSNLEPETLWDFEIKLTPYGNNSNPIIHSNIQGGIFHNGKNITSSHFWFSVDEEDILNIFDKPIREKDMLDIFNPAVEFSIVSTDFIDKKTIITASLTSANTTKKIVFPVNLSDDGKRFIADFTIDASDLGYVIGESKAGKVRVEFVGRI